MNYKIKVLDNGRLKLDLNKGFTLVELLVVISIIAILLGIMMPALNKARGKAGQAVCMTNLRQIGFAMQMYADENRDYYPDPLLLGGSTTTTTSGTRVSAWPFRARPGWVEPGDPRALPEKYGLAAVLGKSDYYGKSPRGAYLDGQSKVWICPSLGRCKVIIRKTIPLYMYELGNTYSFYGIDRLLTVKASSRYKSSTISWTKLDTLVWDNFNFQPMTSGMRAAKTDSEKFKLDPYLSPHPKGKQTTSFNQLSGDLSVVWGSNK
jgi:prepilin-type N-terminal cleavage/methylation domain-containing protein